MQVVWPNPLQRLKNKQKFFKIQFYFKLSQGTFQMEQVSTKLLIAFTETQQYHHEQAQTLRLQVERRQRERERERDQRLGEMSQSAPYM